MSDFKKHWDLEMALQVLQSETIDAETWSEAVKWLMLYGPPEIQNVFKKASSFAIHEHFPDLKPAGYNENGEPCFDIREIAKNMGISEKDAAEKLLKLEQEHGVQHLFDEDDTHKIH